MLLHLYLPKGGYSQVIDFTKIISKYVMVADLVDEDILEEVLEWQCLHMINVNKIIDFIEAKEIARDATSQLAVTT